MNVVCKAIGHDPRDIDINKGMAICRRCKCLLYVHYDITYGETVVDGEIEINPSYTNLDNQK